MGGEVPAENGLTVWEVCSLAYTMAAERADRRDELLLLASLLTGQKPQGITHREELDDIVTAPEED